MHDMEAQVVLMTTPIQAPNRYYKIGGVLKARPAHKGHVYLLEPNRLAGLAAPVKDSILPNKRKFVEVSPDKKRITVRDLIP